jgi:hypothetical protein
MKLKKRNVEYGPQEISPAAISSPRSSFSHEVAVLVTQIQISLAGLKRQEKEK